MKNIELAAKANHAALSTEIDAEPMGIVISRGTRAEPIPMFRAYVYGSAPEAESTSSAKAA